MGTVDEVDIEINVKEENEYYIQARVYEYRQDEGLDTLVRLVGNIMNRFPLSAKQDFQGYNPWLPVSWPGSALR